MSPNKYTGPWLVGMRTRGSNLRVYSVGGPYPLGISEGDDRARPYVGAIPHDAEPDREDGGTVGALAHHVRAAYSRPDIYARPLLPGGWVTYTPDGLDDGPWRFCFGAIEFDAWLAAYHAHRDAAGLTANDIEVIRG